jgi:hypothetical protein
VPNGWRELGTHLAEEMTREDYNREYAYFYLERLGMICESSTHKGGQRPATEADELQARREAGEMMDELERAERERTNRSETTQPCQRIS